MKIKDYTYYYFIGIGGIGMSALARYFYSLNKKVLGYDKTKTPLTQTLEREGIPVHYSDDSSYLKELSPSNTLVIYTPAIKSLSELDYAKQNNFKILKRSEVLGEITKETYTLAVAGTHGKTTTTAMLAHILKIANIPSTSFLGGIAENYQSNLVQGGDKVIVVEADEFDRSFLKLYPNSACITSMDADHLDIYGTESEIQQGFKDFAQHVKENVFVKKGLSIPNAKTYSVEEPADYFTRNLKIIEDYFIFDVVTPDFTIPNVQLNLPGKHNVENALGAIALSLEVKVTPENIREAFATFKGIKRRFTRFKTPNGKVIIDDYAHHPTELNAVINATKMFYPNQKILGIFQPHLYSRTRDFAKEFATELQALDELILLDIYPAREEPISGITSEYLADMIKNTQVEVTSLEKAINEISKKEFDVLLLMGAGDIDTLYEPLKITFDEE